MLYSVADAPTYAVPQTQRELGIQFLIAFSYGSFSLLLFCFWRRKYKFVYEARATRENVPLPLSNSYFGWIRELVKITDEQLSHAAGLDAYVYLTFFRASIALLFKLSLISLFLIAPLRWFYLGQFGDDDGVAQLIDDDSRSPNLFNNYIWVYVASTYVFTFICVRTMQQYSNEVVCVRQRYLGHQKSITDRTLRITGIPKQLRDPDNLNEYFSVLFKTQPEKILLCRNWRGLDALCKQRSETLLKLEACWARYIGVNDPKFVQLTTHRFHDNELKDFLAERNHLRFGRTRLFGPKIDLVSHYEHKLAVLEAKIADAQANADKQRVTSTAFITMHNAADCQMAAQALLSPTPHIMVSGLAPAPNDILWKNVYLKPKIRMLLSYVISLVVLLCSIFLVVPLTYLSRFLDLDTIREHFPRFANWLQKSKLMTTLVTSVLPAYAFVGLNQIVPFFYAWLSANQGFVSSGDVELSTIGKNFFYVFVNLFVIFTIESTFFSFSVDTTEFAKEFAYWLLRLSSFYANFIILQGVGIAPLRLLQPQSIARYYKNKLFKSTARKQHDQFEPDKINYGLLLPTPLLIFILVLTYSILRRWILFFGLVYFCSNYMVYKYQLLYTMVHPQHSNARLWTAILRRVYLGLVVFHLAMIGVLVLQSEYAFAVTIIPLTVSLLGFWYDFEKYTKPLLECVAIEALHQSRLDRMHIGTSTNHLDMFGDTDSDETDAPSASTSQATTANTVSSSLASTTTIVPTVRSQPHPASDPESNLGSPDLDTSQYWNQLDENAETHSTTLEEDREKGITYINENLLPGPEGPWVATDGDDCIVYTKGRFVKTRISYMKWT